MTSRINCALVSADPTLRTTIADVVRAMPSQAALVVDIDAPVDAVPLTAIPEMGRAGTQCIILDFGNQPAAGLEFARSVAAALKDVTFILLGPTASPEILLEAMRIGAAEYLLSPYERSDIKAAVERAVRRVGPVADSTAKARRYRTHFEPTQVGNVVSATAKLLGARRRVFVSYSFPDRDLAELIKDSMRSTANFMSLLELPEPEAWLGQDARNVIQRQIAQSDSFILLWTIDAAQSPWVQYELGVANALNKPIVIVDAGGASTDLPGELYQAPRVRLDPTSDSL
jgi:DNA-binding NarL/FixJ family response regulator